MVEGKDKHGVGRDMTAGYSPRLLQLAYAVLVRI